MGTTPPTEPVLTPGKLRRLLESQDFSTAQVDLIVDEYTAGLAASGLADNASTLQQQKVTAIDVGAFGSSALGQELQQHSTLAHQRLSGAIHVMATAIHGYSEAVDQATKTILGADQDNKQSITGVQETLATSTTQLGQTIAQESTSAAGAGVPAPDQTGGQ